MLNFNHITIKYSTKSNLFHGLSFVISQFEFAHHNILQSIREITSSLKSVLTNQVLQG